MFHRRQVLRLLAPVIAAALAAPAAIAAIGSDDQPAVGAPGTALAEAESVSPSLSSRFGIFRAPGGRDDIPTVGSHRDAAGKASIADVDIEYARSNGMNVTLARRVSTTPRVFAIPGRGVVCLVKAGGSAACTPEAFVGRDFQVQLCGADLPSGTVSVAGLVPDSVTSVAVRRQDGVTVPMTVSHNYGHAELPVGHEGELPASVELVGDSGKESLSLSSVRMSELDCARRL